ncbi:hypothetical protein FXW07_00275 [Methanosarcina sp. DH1]|uniref:S1 family peptidase n=1 Tax=Methanosarcina sp. DH1 TaxID=2605695 RepID=UPI001E4C8FA9|nr:serine protease [Methanosarcina sp. DH1]MCC4765122.1 hypothetical protein [Methanosarcina sp. DH1]
MSDSRESSIVKVLSDQEKLTVGAGVLIGKKWVLTCRHVVETALPIAKKGDKIYLTFFRHESAEPIESYVHYLAKKEEPDFAILELEEEAPQYASIAKLVTKNFMGRELHACGFPYGADGVWVQLNALGSADSFSVQIDITSKSRYKIKGGFSGTPVFDAKLDDVFGMVVTGDSDEEIFSGCFTPVDSILNVCKKHSIDKAFEFLCELDPIETPLGKIANLIVTFLQNVPFDRQRRNETIKAIANTHNVDLRRWSRDEDLCFPLAMAMLNMGIEEFSPILHELGDVGILDYKNIIKIFELLKPYWVDSRSASCIYERALYPNNSQAIALNASKSISAELCIRRASCRHPNMWPMCTPSDVFGADAANEIVDEILYEFLQQMLKTQDIDEIFPELDFNAMDPDQQREELKSLICSYKTTNLQPVFFVFKYSNKIVKLLPAVQEKLPCVTLFLLTEDRYPNPVDLGGFDCEFLLDFGIKRENNMIRHINNTKSSFSIFRNNS